MGNGITAEFDLGAIECEYNIPTYSAKGELLFHNRKPQRIPQCMTLAFKLERSGCLGSAGELSCISTPVIL